MKLSLKLKFILCIVLMSSQLTIRGEGLSPAAQIMAAVNQIELCKSLMEAFSSEPVDWYGEVDESELPEPGDPEFDDADENGDGVLTGSLLITLFYGFRIILK